eukprot:scaffold932_cov328-Pavlova_lutheri.AAC.49
MACAWTRLAGAVRAPVRKEKVSCRAEQRGHGHGPLFFQAEGGTAAYGEAAYLESRARIVRRHFTNALGVEDFMSRLEIILAGYGFNGDNSIAMINLCRDEITQPLKEKIDMVFGQSFNTNGLGAILTCGTTGIGAGLSHSPISVSGKERYVFFSFPHIAIDASGEIGAISRPMRPGKSCACGALNKALQVIQSQGLENTAKEAGVHEQLDPEFSILLQSLARKAKEMNQGAEVLDLVEITKMCEKMVTEHLELLISQCVDPSKADYAVVTGVQIHSWGVEYDDLEPNLEFISPSTAYTVVNQEKTYIDISAVPALTPRQIRLLAVGGKTMRINHKNSKGNSTSPNTSSISMDEDENISGSFGGNDEEPEYPFCSWPSWESTVRLNKSGEQP